MDPITGLAAIVAALPMLYIVQASIDATLERRERAKRKAESRNKRARIIIKRSKRRAAVAIIRKMEREMRAEDTVREFERLVFGPPPAFLRGKVRPSPVKRSI